MRQSRNELFYGIILFAVVGFSCPLLQKDILALTLSAAILSFGILLMLLMHHSLKKRIYKSQQQPVKMAMLEYKQMVIARKKLLKRLAYYLVPLLFAVSLIPLWDVTHSFVENVWKFTLYIGVSSLFMVGFFLYEFKPYINRRYNSILQTLNNYLEDLA